MASGCVNMRFPVRCHALAVVAGVAPAIRESKARVILFNDTTMQTRLKLERRKAINSPMPLQPDGLCAHTVAQAPFRTVISFPHIC